MDPRGNAVEAEEDGDRSSQICKIYVNGIEIRPLRKRLIILDVNGLLADVVCPPPEDHMADVTIEGRAIFKRPFYLDFLNFCFENFEVGIWSSRREQFVGRDIDYLIPPFLKNKLVFCWDGSYCTEAWIYKQGKKSIVYSKDLRKLWQKGDPNLPWNKLYYNESNTLMLDVCPYRGILNPRTTTVYPLPFNYHDNDNSLAQGGELRAYLQGLTEVDDMRKYVKEHPFGQEAINNDGSYCTEAWIYKQGKKSIVYSKDLRKLWQKGDPNLPWNKLYYNESNTLMLDVCPYRGILNPRTTTVYPLPFNYHDNDNSLAQGGELRAYLQGLTEVDDMRKYVKEHPFGQEAINNASINWIRHSRYILEYRKD